MGLAEARMAGFLQCLPACSIWSGLWGASLRWGWVGRRSFCASLWRHARWRGWVQSFGFDAKRAPRWSERNTGQFPNGERKRHRINAYGAVHQLRADPGSNSFQHWDDQADATMRGISPERRFFWATGGNRGGLIDASAPLADPSKNRGAIPDTSQQQHMESRPVTPLPVDTRGNRRSRSWLLLVPGILTPPTDMAGRRLPGGGYGGGGGLTPDQERPAHVRCCRGRDGEARAGRGEDEL